MNKGIVNLGALAVLLSACSQPQLKDDASTLSQNLPSPPLEAVEPAAGLVSFTSVQTIHIVDVTQPMIPDWAVDALPDTLDVIRAGYQLPDSEQRAIDAQLDWYRQHQAYLDRVFTRSSRYLHHIVGEIAARGMPMEIALLPIVESAFDPFAYSHGRAAGLWQFIPATGRRYGLKQDWWYDGRRDIIESTRGALDYLEALAKQFDNDWLLAIAAYNSGEGNVHRAIRRNRKAGKPIDFWSLAHRLPAETRAYVPKLLAVSRLVADPDGNGVTIMRIRNEPYFSVVKTHGQLDLALAADLAGVSVEEIYALNPGYNRWATDPAGPNRLLVPVDAAAAFESNLAALPAREQVQWERYRIRNGDSLSVIARKFHTTQKLIREVNNLRGSTIRAGKYLMIPRASKSAAAYTLSADARLARTMTRSRGSKRTLYRVQPGDSLWTIARKYGVSTRNLAKWNGMAPRDTLSVGRKLVIWGGKNVASIGSGPPKGRVRQINYTVRKGDSLWKISSRFKVSVNQLKSWNSLSGKRVLRPGQRLVMYIDVTKQSGG
ncbi:MAG: LysM peptidoglycan-binding domain-containing protein [Proteobacteria bacterium]|nr:LysM peptidoglycan-binding domain-containing protein [Pseudomonadota bacterium]